MTVVVGQVGPEGALNAWQRETLCGGSISAFSAIADYGPPPDGTWNETWEKYALKGIGRDERSNREEEEKGEWVGGLKDLRQTGLNGLARYK